MRGLRGLVVPAVARPRELVPRGLRNGKGSSPRESESEDRGDPSLENKNNKMLLNDQFIYNLTSDQYEIGCFQLLFQKVLQQLKVR